MSNKTEKLEVRCSPKLRQALERVAEAQEMKLSEVVRAALEHYVAPSQAFTVPVLGTIQGGVVIWNSQEVKQ